MLTRMLIICSILASASGLLAPAAAEHVVLPYQGILKKAGQLYTGPAEMKFAIVEASTVLWSSDDLDKTTQQPRRSVTVQVADGQFCASLGENPMKPLDSQVLTRHPTASLRVWVSTGGTFEQLTDQPLDAEGATRDGSGGDHWSLRGNRNIDPDQDFLGTTDDHPVVVRANSTRILTLPCLGPVEVHKSFLVHGDETVDQNLNVTGDLSTKGTFSLSGSLTLDGDATIGGDLNVAGQAQFAKTLAVSGDASCKTLTILGGSDVAEPFPTSPSEDSSIQPGIVMSIDPDNPGRLVVASRAYDRMVAGVLSGANGVQPGLVMSSQGNSAVAGTHNLALSGRVYVRATTTNGPIGPGDLLTSSSTPGCAMRATNPLRTRGAVIGKAMSSLSSGTGFVLLLVQPQ